MTFPNTKSSFPVQLKEEKEKEAWLNIRSSSGTGFRNRQVVVVRHMSRVSNRHVLLRKLVLTMHPAFCPGAVLCPVFLSCGQKKVVHEGIGFVHFKILSKEESNCKF